MAKTRRITANTAVPLTVGGSIFPEAEIIRSDRKTLAAEIRRGKLLIRAPLRASDVEIFRFLREHRRWIEKHLAKAQAAAKTADARRLTAEELRALADRARRVILQRAAYFAPIVGVSYGRVTIRSQRSRWGSCSRKGNLNFNCLLMLAPPEVLDSVIVHELCHRKEMNHSERFYAEVLRVLPDYREWAKWLKEHGETLMAMLPETQ